jgi:hypothetical protein
LWQFSPDIAGGRKLTKLRRIALLVVAGLLMHIGLPYASRAITGSGGEAAQFTTDGATLRLDPPKWVDPGWRILDETTYVRLDERGDYDATLEFSYKALNEQGVKSLIEGKYKYDAHRESLTFENFATVKPDGRILTVDPIAVLDRTADPSLPEPFLDDKRVKVAVFANVEPGDVVRGRVTWHERQSEFAGRFASAYAYNSQQAIDTRRIVVDAPRSLALNTKAIGAEEKVETKGARVIRTVVFPHRDPAGLTDAADNYDAGPRYEISSFSSWADVASIIRAKNATAAQPDAAVIAKAKELVAGVSDKRERIKRVYDWVAQNIRYVAIETGGRGFESMTAHQTFANRFGDCKAHVTLLKAMLSAIGEPGHLVLIDIAPRYSQPSLPTPYFEHAILFAPSINMYLDATSYQNPFGALPLPLADKPALDVETGVMTRTPLATPADVRLTAETHITFAADGAGKAHTVMTGEKSGDGVRRGAAEHLQEGDTRGEPRAMLATFGLDGDGQFTFGDPRDLSAPFKLTADYTFDLHNGLEDQPQGVRLSAPVDSSAWLTWYLFGDRYGSAAACAPVDLTDVVSATLPEGYSVASVPPPRDFEEETTGRTKLGEVKGKVAYHVGFEATGREIKQTTHATFEFSRGLCDATVIERAWRAAVTMNNYRWQAIRVASSDTSSVRRWFRTLLVAARQGMP